MSNDVHRLAVRIGEAVRLTGIGRTKLFAAIRTGHLKARKFGRVTIIRVADLDAFLAQLPARASGVSGEEA